MSEPTLRLAQVLLVSMASGLALGATVPRVAIERDPTRPPSFTSAPGEAPTLDGGGQGVPSPANRLTTTVVAAGASFAVIDGHRVEEGDFVAGARVVKIDPASVKLSGRAGPYELRFYSLPVKVEPGTMAELAARLAPSVKADSDVKAEQTAEATPGTGAELDGEVEPGVETEPAVEVESGVDADPASDAAGQMFDE